MFVNSQFGEGVYGQLVLSTQTPEPISLCLFGSGILGLAVVLRRKQALRR